MADAGPLPSRQGHILLDRIRTPWDELSRGKGAATKVILRRTSDVQAHANGKSIEVTSCLAQRLVLSDASLIHAIRTLAAPRSVHLTTDAVRSFRNRSGRRGLPGGNAAEERQR